MVDVTFTNVMITITANDAQDAYHKLCEMLNPVVQAFPVEYGTDKAAYMVRDNYGTLTEAGNVDQLWPSIEEVPNV